VQRSLLRQVTPAFFFKSIGGPPSRMRPKLFCVRAFLFLPCRFRPAHLSVRRLAVVEGDGISRLVYPFHAARPVRCAVSSRVDGLPVAASEELPQVPDRYLRGFESRDFIPFLVLPPWRVVESAAVCLTVVPYGLFPEVLQLLLFRCGPFAPIGWSHSLVETTLRLPVKGGPSSFRCLDITAFFLSRGGACLGRSFPSDRGQPLTLLRSP